MTTSIRGLMGSKRNLVFGVALGLLIAGTGTPAISAEQSGTSPEGTAGLQAGSWVAAIADGAVKVGYALGGGLRGGRTWVLKGGDTDAAEGVRTASRTGRYTGAPKHRTR